MRLVNKHQGNAVEWFAVEGSGLIELRRLANGDVAVIHTGKGLVEDVIRDICGRDRCYRDHTFRHWVIYADFAEEVTAELAARATRLKNRS
jgi:hypothetical protein